MIYRPTEDAALSLIAREQAMRRNLAALETDYEQLIVILNAIGWRQIDLSRALTVHGYGFGRGSFQNIKAKAQSFEVAE